MLSGRRTQWPSPGPKPVAKPSPAGPRPSATPVLPPPHRIRLKSSPQAVAAANGSEGPFLFMGARLARTVGILLEEMEKENTT